MGIYVEMVGLQKLQIQSASLVAIGANPLDFLPTASPSSHHPHRPPGSGQFMGSFPPNVFLFTGHFFPENVFRPSTDPPLKGGPKPSSRPFFREGFQIQFSPFGKFRTGRAIFFRPTPKFFADRFTEVGCGGEVEVASPFGEDGCQERCRAADTTRTPRASTYFGSTTLSRNPAPLLP